MNVYCFSDYHNEERYLPEMRKKAGKADIIISAGDHSVFEFDQDKALKEFNKWKKPVYLFHGNHEEESTTKEAVKKYKHITFTHGEELIINNIRLLTWGGGGFSLHDRELEKKITEWKKSKHAHLPTILITHAPPRDTTLDARGPDWHVGSKSVRKAIEQLKPAYAVSGHIHDSEGAEDKIGNTICYNLGPRGRLIEL